MAYRIDKNDNSLVLDGVENGIADSPHQGISDMRNVNIISVPKESSVGFATELSSTASVGIGTVISADAAADTITYTGAIGLANGQAVVFTGGSLPTGIVAGTVYWVFGVSSGVLLVATNFIGTNLLNITATGTGTFTVFNITSPKHSAYDSGVDSYWMVDDIGQVWSTAFPVSTGGGLAATTWRYTGNNGGNGRGVGNGLVYYQASDGTGYIFVFRDSRIDYTKSVNSLISWVYGWNPADGSVGNTTNVLKTGGGQDLSHEAIVAPNNQVTFCDLNWVGRWYEKNPSTPFDPTNVSTYVWDQTALLPSTDITNSITYLGSNYLIGGQRNVLYSWNGTATSWSSVILLPENGVSKMVTVNANTYIFAGNRGRIYYTNGSQAQLYKKLPDHISGTIEPYFQWGGATFNKNQLYFGALATTNSGGSISQYGGVWGIDLDTKAIRLTNKLSYGNYAGYATVIIARVVPLINVSNPPGTGLYIGWNNGSSTYGIDTTTTAPYTGSQATIDFDLIPIGTFNKPQNFGQVEYKLTRPLVSGESVVLKTRLIFNTTDTEYVSTLSDSTIGDFSNTNASNIANAQWVQFQAVLNSTVSNPSYVRLTEIRIKLV